MGAELQQVQRHEEVRRPAPQPEQAEHEGPREAPTAVEGVARAGGELLRVLDETVDPPPPAAPPGDLVIGRADDPLEADADRAAAAVVQHLRRSTGAAPATTCCDSSSGHLHRRSSPGADPLGGTSASREVSDVVARGGGSALPGPFREQVQEAFGGVDLGHVRVHADSAAASATRAAGAQAFTVGSHIYFGQGGYDTSSARGQELIAHELAHVVQAGPAASVHRKMWDPKHFQKMTYESWHTQTSDAQDAIVVMIKDYIATYEAHGVVSKQDAPAALARIAEMRQSAEYWINDHTITDTKTGATKTDPKRQRRMAGFVAFRAFLDKERQELEAYDRGAGGTGGTAPAVVAATPGFLKLQEKYEGNAKSFFEKMGDLAQKAVSANGDSCEIEATIKFPVDPSGVGFIGGKFTAGIEKDSDQVKIKGSLSITGGADVDVAQVAGELGGYLEAQAATGGKAMELLSYAMYRRFRESHWLPNEAANYLWGGQTSSYGFDKAEAWSLGMEEQAWGATAPGRDATYVESGAQAAVGVSGNVGVAKGELSVKGSTGRRVDLTSLTNRKGGAGKANLPSDSALAKTAHDLSGGTRGAQKRVGREVHGLSVSGKIAGDVGVASLAADATLALKWMNNGMSKKAALNPTGTASTTTLTDGTLEIAGAVGIQLGDLAGDAVGHWVELLQDKVDEFIAKKAAPAAAAQAQTGDEAAQQALSRLWDLSRVLGAGKLKDDLVEESAKLAGATVGSTGKAVLKKDAYRLSVTFDLVNSKIAFELKRVQESGIELPKSIAMKMTTASRLFRFTYAGGAWTRG